MRDVIMCGFLVKSPPDVADNGKSGKIFRDLYCGGRPPRLLRKRWRERYCVLYKLRSQNKTEVYFEYYKDSNCLKLKGRVDLESCECIVHNAEVESWSNVFSIHTLYNQRRRIYYFAAPNPETMSTWVQNLVTVTGFVDTTQPTLERRPTTTVPPLLSPRPSTTAAPNPPWDRDAAAPLNRATRPEGGGTQPWAEDGYGDLNSVGVDYLMSGPEDDQDGYYKLPCATHSYVNLSPQGDHENEVSPGDSARNTRTSCPTLPARTAGTRPMASAENLTDAPPRPQKDGARSGGGEQPKEGGGTATKNGSTTDTAQLGERRSSNNSVYFNVWESGHEEDIPYAKVEPSPVQRKQQTMPPPAVSKRQQMPSYPARVYRRSQLVSDYHQLPAALPSQAPSGRRPVPPPLPAQKPVPPPRAPTTTTSVIATLPPAVPPTFGRAASVETCTDIPLPFRAPGLGNVADSSMESNSSGSSNSLLSLPSSEHNGDVDNREHSTLRPAPESSFSSGAPLEHAPPPPSTNNINAPTTVGSTNSEGVPSSHVITSNQNDVVLKLSASNCDSNGVDIISSHRPPNQQLNYIEPCNLDLGSDSANGPGTRTNHHPAAASSNVKGRVLADHVRCVAPPEQTEIGNIPPLCPRNLPSKRWATTGSATSNPTGTTVTDNEDYKIEYKEIDPISTNALAIVTKRYLDDDTTT